VEEGVKKGPLEGARLEKIQTAKKLLSMGMDIATVCQATKLTEAEVLVPSWWGYW